MIRDIDALRFKFWRPYNITIDEKPLDNLSFIIEDHKEEKETEDGETETVEEEEEEEICYEGYDDYDDCMT